VRREVLFRVGLCNVLLGYGLGTLVAVWLLGSRLDPLLTSFGFGCLGAGVVGQVINFFLYHAERIRAEP
jgi:hypothetical protein